EKDLLLEPEIDPRVSVARREVVEPEMALDVALETDRGADPPVLRETGSRGDSRDDERESEHLADRQDHLPTSLFRLYTMYGRRAVSRQRAFDSPRVQVPRRRLSRAAARASRGRQTRSGRDAFRVRGDGSSRDRARGAPPRIPSRGAPRGSGGEGARPFVLAAAPPQDSRDVAAERARPGAPPVERRGSVSSGGPVTRDSSPDRRRRDVGVDCARMRPGSRR